MSEDTINAYVNVHSKDGLDKTSPYSFYEWVKRNPDIGETIRYSEYQNYVVKWNEEKRKEYDAASRLRQDYINFVKSVVPYIADDANFKLDHFDFNDSLDLERLIPYFTKRIKEIMMYLISKREAIVRSKLKYNMHGAFISIERMLHEWLLSNYTHRKYRDIDYDILKNQDSVPDLYDVNTTLTVRQNEYYDDQNYFDKNPKMGAKTYFSDIVEMASGAENREDLSALYGDWLPTDGNTEGIVWLFDGGLNDRKIDNPIFYAVRDAVLGTSALNEYEADKAANKYVYELTKKYIGNDIGYLSGGYFVEDWRHYKYDFKTGNNWFYFPSGGYDYQDIGVEIDPISINDTTISAGATAAIDYKDADRIFVRKEGEVKGAWLRKRREEWVDKTMTVSVPMKYSYSFRYPFAGYGTSGYGVEWSGPIYENNNPLYLALDEEEREGVKKLYWDNPPEDYQASAMSIQRFNIADMPIASALGSRKYIDAMHMSVREDGTEPNEAVYNEKAIDQFWLYYPKTTEYIARNCKNFYEFPHYTLKDENDRSEFYDIRWCAPVYLSAVSTLGAFRGGKGGSCAANSDIIYKIDDNGNVVEAAWLSGMPVECIMFTSANNEPVPVPTPDAKKKQEEEMARIASAAVWQDLEFINKYDLVLPTFWFANVSASVSGLFHQYEYGFSVEPGEDEYFIYTGWSPYDNRDAFKDALGGPFVSACFIGNSDIPEFQTIPYTEGCVDCDMIYPCDDYPLQKTPEEIRQSRYIFSGGEWHSEIKDFNEKPVIVKNVLYKYHRSSTAKTKGVFRIINESYHSVTTTLENGQSFTELRPIVYTKWMKMRRNENGEWEGSYEQPTDMILRSGDRFVYDSVQTSRVVASAIFEGLNDYEFILRNIPHLVKIPLTEVRPYWASAANLEVEDNEYKSIDVYGNGFHWEENLHLFNPKISNKVVSALDHMSVYSKIPFLWEQPVRVYEPHEDVVWSKLDTTYIDVPVSAIYGNDHIVRDMFDYYINAADKKSVEYREGVISAVPTKEPSDIVFSYTDGDQVLFNYWAKNPFTWEQDFLNVKNGVPPSGGKYIPYEVSSGLVESIYPYANLSNRHYPTLALVPDASKFYRKEDVGGYFVPKYLGVSEAISKKPVVVVDPTVRNEKDNAIDAISIGEEFAQDDGFTSGRENAGLIVDVEDLDWIKIPIGIGANAGMRVCDPLVQSFVPYITEEECRNDYDKGLTRADDIVDPWIRNGGYTWNDVDVGSGYKQHRSGQQPIERWANDRFTSHEITKYKSDIFGFSYVLVKDIDGTECIYEEREKSGTMYYHGVGDNYENISAVNEYISKYPIVAQSLIDNFDVAYDMLFITGELPLDPIADIRIDAADKIARWKSWFSDENSVVTKAGEKTLYGDVYDQDMKNKASQCYSFGFVDVIRGMMERYIRHYKIYDLDNVGKGCERPYETLQYLHDCIELLYATIRDHFVDTIRNLPIDIRYRKYLTIDDDGNIIHDQLDDILAAMEGDDDHPKDTLYGMMYTFVRTCEELMKFHLFDEGKRCYLAFPVSVDTNDSVAKIKTDVGKIVHREYDFPIKMSPGWFLEDRRSYIVPLNHISAGKIIPRFDRIDTKTMAMKSFVCGEDVYNKVSQDVSASIGSQITSSFVLNPVCSYNEKTENLVVVQQVSGENSLIGPIAIYDYNMIDGSIYGTTIIPYDSTEEFKEYEHTHTPVRPEDHEPSSSEGFNYATIPFYDTRITAFCVKTMDIDGEHRVILSSNFDNPSVEQSPLLEVDAIVGRKCEIVDGNTMVFNPSGDWVRLDDYRVGDTVSGVYSSANGAFTPYPFDRDVAQEDNPSGYVIWKKDPGLVPMYSEHGTFDFVYPSTNPLLNPVAAFQSQKRALNAYFGYPTSGFAKLLAYYCAPGTYQIDWPEYLPTFAFNFDVGYELNTLGVYNASGTRIGSFMPSALSAQTFDFGDRIEVEAKESDLYIGEFKTIYMMNGSEVKLIPDSVVPPYHLYDRLEISAGRWAEKSEDGEVSIFNKYTFTVIPRTMNDAILVDATDREETTVSLIEKTQNIYGRFIVRTNTDSFSREMDTYSYGGVSGESPFDAAAYEAWAGSSYNAEFSAYDIFGRFGYIDCQTFIDNSSPVLVLCYEEGQLPY